MLSITPRAEPEAEPANPQGEPSEKPYDFDSEIPAADAPAVPQASGEFVMGPRQLASVAFVGILLLGIMSAVAYFAGRKNTEGPKVTERVIERVVQAPAPVLTPAPVPAPAQPVTATTTPTTTTVSPAVAAPPAGPKTNAEVTSPILNRLYLQAGSVEVGVAEVMVEGLRHRGVPAIVGIGINPKVARVLIGPFENADQQRILQKRVEDFGFHPYPRSFTAKDLEQQQITPVDAVKPVPMQSPIKP